MGHGTLRDLFTDHPKTVGETYWQHLFVAAWFSFRLLIAGIACLIHAVFPFLFTRTGSTIVAGLFDRMVVNRRRQPRRIPEEGEGAD